jgi:CTP synthase
MMRSKFSGDVFVVLTSYLVTPSLLGEQKSKPTQRAVLDLYSVGLKPDFVFCRADKPASPDIKRTISNVCSIPIERIISVPDVYSLYDVPVNFEKENFGNTLLQTIGLPARERDMTDWTVLANKIKKINKEVTIGIVGKYFNSKSCKDTYISVIESINHATWAQGFKPKILWLDSEKYENDPKLLSELDKLGGIIVPGGFGNRGVEGMILAANYARLKKIPYFGLCLGVQILTISYARNVLKLKGANSTEMDANTPHPVIATMADQIDKIKNKNYGGTMRLGAYDCILAKDTVAYGAYKTPKISERHRHRYEVNNKYVAELEQAGLVFSGRSPDGVLMEIAELPKKVHPFYLGTQFHPEFKSRPLVPHPLFTAFIRACINKKK